MIELDKLQTEWLILVALKECLSIVKKEPGISNMDAIRFANQIAPGVFNNSEIGLHEEKRLENIASAFEQRALTELKDGNTNQLAIMLIENRIGELQKQITQYDKGISKTRDSLEHEISEEKAEKKILREELSDLNAIMNIRNGSLLNLERITESQAILNDVFLNRPGKIQLKNHLGKFNTYIDKDNKTIFRIAILHPNPSEAITGADLIYEQYNRENDKVRIAAIQYKIWEDEKLYFSKNSRLEEQLKKMEKCFCHTTFCKDESSTAAPEPFPRPCCCAFIRPTNKMQHPGDTISVGYHLPICRIDDLKTKGYKNYMLDFYKIRSESVESQIFEELFNKEVLGSKWVKKSELESFYRKSKVLEPSQKIVFYVQNMKL